MKNQEVQEISTVSRSITNGRTIFIAETITPLERYLDVSRTHFDEDNCIVFHSDPTQSVRFHQQLLLSTKYNEAFYIKYKLKSTLQCTEMNIAYAEVSSKCLRLHQGSCWLLKAFPNDEYCYAQCSCATEGECHVQIVVRNITNYTDWALCPADVA